MTTLVTEDVMTLYLEASRSCVDDCMVCAEHCKETPGMEECMEACLETASKCRELLSQPYVNPVVLWNCGILSTHCAEVCSSFNDAYCKLCATSCRRCEAECMTLAVEQLFGDNQLSSYAQL